MRLWKKFALLGVFGVVLVGITFSLYVYEANKTIHAAEQEISGIEPLRELLQALQFAQQHRGMAMLTLNGDQAAQANRSAREQATDKAMDSLNSMLGADLEDKAIMALWQQTLSSWKNLQKQVSAGSIKATESFAAHTSMISGLLRVKSLLLQYYGLSFDPEAQGFYLIDASLNQAPMLTELFGQTRALGSGVLTRKAITPEERVQIITLLERANEHYLSLNDALENATRFYPQLGEILRGPGSKALEGIKDVIGLARAQILDTNQLNFAAADYFDRFTKAIDAQFALNSVAIEQLEATLKNRVSGLQNTRLIMITVILLISALAGFCNFLITRALLRQLGGEPGYATSILDQIANGNLATNIKLHASDQHSMLHSMRVMRDRLADIVGQVRSGANAIATASGQISAGNLDLSARTEQQANALATAASTMEEITATVRQNADNALQANDLSASAAKTATTGGTIVSELVGSMAEINTRSQQVADIVGIIDSIAFQTNILALNAAVEAARAGEQGRGFAVVASEVRALAQRSAGAAKEIKTLIDSSVESAARGNDQATRAGATMQEIVEGVRHVTDIMSEISSASREQSLGLEEISGSVTQMDDVTRQNASLVEESVAAAASLKDQADALAAMVSFFQLDGAHQTSGQASLSYQAPALSQF